MSTLSCEDYQPEKSALVEVVYDGGEFFRRAIEILVRQIPEGTRVTSDTIRQEVERGRITPRHWNVWGALVTTLVRRGALEKTDQLWHTRRSSITPLRVRPVYRVAGWDKR